MSEHFTIELDTKHVRFTGESLHEALRPALEEAGIVGPVTFSYVGSHQAGQTRTTKDVGDLLLTAGTLYVYSLALYLPNKIAGGVIDRLVERLAEQVRSWRRVTGNTHLDVPIYGPDGETILTTVHRESGTKDVR